MNWGRGLLRLGVAGAMLWVAVGLAIQWRQFACKWLPAAEGSDGRQSYSCSPFDRFAPPIDTLGIVLGPPVVVLLVGGLLY